MGEYQLDPNLYKVKMFPSPEDADYDVEIRNEALRDDSGKARYDLLPPIALASLVDVYSFGAKKYAPNNWRKGMNWSRCFASMCRHLFAWWRGEDFDKESGLHHLAHVAWGCFTLIEYDSEKLGVDDRPYKENN